MHELTGPLHGHADSNLEDLVERFSAFLLVDPDLSFQMAAYVAGRPVLDVWGGPHLGQHSLMIPFSVSKNTIGLSVALLIDRGQLDLDAPVAHYWPEFAAAGKAGVTVRQMLSHQAGLPAALPRLTWDELLDPHSGAEKLAATRPFWHPGSAFGYHGLTIGNLASELVYRISGATLQEFFEREIRSVVGSEFYLGLPAELEPRRVDVLEIIPPLAERPNRTLTGYAPLVFGPHPGQPTDDANDPRTWRLGHPAHAATASARGIAQTLAALVTGLDGRAPMLSADTVAVISQQQVRGYDEVLGQNDRAHAIVFQKPSAVFNWGGARSFGHDGARGALGCVDPDSGVAFAYTVARGPFPGGADPRAITAAHQIGQIAW